MPQEDGQSSNAELSHVQESSMQTQQQPQHQQEPRRFGTMNLRNNIMPINRPGHKDRMDDTFPKSKKRRLGLRHGPKFCKPRRRPRTIASKKSLFSSLYERQLGFTGAQRFKYHSMKWRFFQSRLKTGIDIHAPIEYNAGFTLHPGILARSHILEIICVDDVTIALTNSGLCRSFDSITLRPLGLLNTHRLDVVRTMFYNRYDRTIITVSVSRDDPTYSLICRVVSLSHIQQGKVKDESFSILHSEHLSHPGFVEFDDANGKILSYCPQSHMYRVWSLRDYRMVFEVDGQNVQEVKISSKGMLLVIYHRVINPVHVSNSAQHLYKTTIPMEVMDIENGESLKLIAVSTGFTQVDSDEYQSDDDTADMGPIEFVEILNENLLLKRYGHSLRVIDVMRSHSKDNNIASRKVDHFAVPDAFVFLYATNFNLSFHADGPELWNTRGKYIARLEKHHLFNKFNTSHICVCRDQCTLISIGHHSLANALERNIPSHERRRSAIRVNSLLTGALLWELEGEDLATICALWFNEKRSELYVGRGDGSIQIISNESN